MSDGVTQHYGSTGIAERVLAAVAASGADPGQLRPEMLFPYDQLHARELKATEEHVAWLAPRPDEHVLDVGSGVGGPARFVAAKTSARVTGIDLTPDFVAAARSFTERCGLADRVTFEVGNALDMPFPEATFDAAICQYVAMNVAGKEGLAREIARVLKPGGRLLWSEAVGIEGRDPPYPLPWARSPETNHLTTESGLREALERAGLTILEWRDETTLQVEHAHEARRAGQTPSPERMMANQIVMGDDFLDRRRNYIAGLEAGALKGIAILARA
ncbi:class I SAM-dependent methyltransferase [Devosia nitrariae]|uniref:Type 11 methyltransferase n=1 Tax=Devosia nitrariae TaxID=2071872 RepID=A0ABQ5WB27_9HYPH|nr:class I SAM-dependent methyltransferase [Devosia nitrariae]GLQ56996.1 type 11 methyltransferase [Devosia nitrariae]